MINRMLKIAIVSLIGLLLVCETNRAQSVFEVAAEVDRLINQQTQPSTHNICDDETFLRRLFLDITGKTPSLDDILVFSLEDHAEKRTKVAELLLQDPDYGTNWGRFWRDVIYYRRSNDQILLGATTAERYFADTLNGNTSWDQFANELITSSGDIRENGRTALIAAQQGRPEETVSEISRIFLGIQIQCAQCHDHPTDRWKQEQFHELAAFFPRVAVRPQMDPRTFLVYAVDNIRRQPRTNNNRFIGTLEHRMPNFEDPAIPGPEVAPKFFLNGKQLPLGATDIDRRSALAAWITSPDNPWFAKATVNRIWSELVGEGFHEPVDDMGPDREAIAPAAFDYLAAKFTESGYDMKWLIATIVSTSHYQLESQDRRPYDQLPFQANTAQPLRSDQLMDAVLNTLRFPELPERAEFNIRRQFSDTFGYDPNNLREEVAGTIPQALMLMNGDAIHRQITAQSGTMLGNLLLEVPNNRQAIQELYLKTLSRRPNRKELSTTLRYIQQVGNRSEAFEDILWALINISEFKTRH
ncbi:MAG: hypothetical protein CMJ76_14990 [Planctomycetaceae bacterium]|nr:hypothetical protein [Planctomycetaceae bacterium]